MEITILNAPPIDTECYNNSPPNPLSYSKQIVLVVKTDFTKRGGTMETVIHNAPSLGKSIVLRLKI